MRDCVCVTAEEELGDELLDEEDLDDDENYEGENKPATDNAKKVSRLLLGIM